MIAATQTLQTQLHYTCVGHGPDVLLIHGWASSGRMWSPLMRALQPTARLWAVDLYGFGASPRPLDGPMPDVNLHTRMVADFCDQHGIRPAAVIGHSMGGMLTLKLALTRPDLARGLVLISAVVTGRYGHPINLNKLVASEWGNFAMAKSKPLWMLAQSDVLAALLSTPWYMSEADRRRTMEDFQRTSWQAAIFALLSIARENLETHLSSLPNPALIIVGAKDFTVPPDESRLAARRLRDSRLLELPDSHHHPLEEQPERVIEAVRQFLIERCF